MKKGPPDSESRVHAMVLLAEKMRAFATAGRFERSFELGERIMAARPPAEVVESLMYPFDTGLATFPNNRFYELLSILERKPAPRRLRAWHALTASVLLDRLRWSGEAINRTEELLSMPPRYGWMRWHRGLMILNNHWDYALPRADFLAVLASTPQVWKATALIAEIDLAEGKPEQAFLAMDRLAETVVGPDLISILAWRGEMRLWIGQYQQAMPDLDWSAARGSPLALCWRGACLLKLGRTAEALRDLDEQLRKRPDDFEARCWRGEARRISGMKAEALEDLDRVLEHDNDVWAHVNRGLLRAELGDREGMWADYSSLPDRVRHYFHWKLGVEISTDSPVAEVTAQLQAILTAARGVRRMNQYLTRLWISLPS